MLRPKEHINATKTELTDTPNALRSAQLQTTVIITHQDQLKMPTTATITNVLQDFANIPDVKTILNAI